MRVLARIGTSVGWYEGRHQCGAVQGQAPVWGVARNSATEACEKREPVEDDVPDMTESVASVSSMSSLTPQKRAVPSPVVQSSMVTLGSCPGASMNWEAHSARTLVCVCARRPKR